jgi:gamma-glutamylcyclotransferase (GGCT)/AIG2-like uncharacterized protein YtfP
MSRQYAYHAWKMAPQVLYRVLWQNPSPPKHLRDQLEIKPAMLHSFCRHKVFRAHYPGISPQEGKSVLGVYVTGLNERHMRNLDYFEGDQYIRYKVKVKLLEGVGIMETGGTEGEEVEAETYVFMDKEDVVDEEWDFKEFVRDKMRRWVESNEEFECTSKYSSRVPILRVC